VFDRAIKPLSSGRIKVTVDPGALPIGKVMRQITIESDDPSTRIRIVSIAMKVGRAGEDGNASDGIIVAPSVVNYGRTSVDAIEADASYVDVLFPLDGSRGPVNYIVVQQPDPDVELIFERASHLEKKLRYTYKIKWLKRLPVGEFVKYIGLSVADSLSDSTKRLRIKLAGDATPEGRAP
jgi:hypothetical protein